MYIHFNGNPCSKNTGDCVVRAISIATGKAWYQVYAGLCVQGRIDCGFGNFNEVWSNYLLYLGFSRHGLPYNTRYTVGDFAADHPRGTQAILDKLCALELDGVKSQLAQAQRENLGLQNAVNMATMQASQTAQTAQILAGQAAEIDGVYNRLKNCPVPTTPVYGNQPIFSCAQNFAGGCGCGA